MQRIRKGSKVEWRTKPSRVSGSGAPMFTKDHGFHTTVYHGTVKRLFNLDAEVVIETGTVVRVPRNVLKRLPRGVTVSR